MRLLYLIIKENGREATFNRIKAQCNAMSKFADTNIITHKANIQKSFNNINTLSWKSKFLKQLYDFMPDILHIYGSWSYAAYKAMIWARKRGFVVIYSPYGVFAHLTKTDKDFWKMYAPMWVVFQRKMISSTEFLIAKDTEEQKRLRRTNKKAMISLVDRKQDDNNIVEMMFNTYKTIIDSNIFRYMHQREKDAFCLLLRTGIEQTMNLSFPKNDFKKTHSGFTLSADDEKMIRNLNDNEVYRICLFSKRLIVDSYINVALRQFGMAKDNAFQLQTIKIGSELNESIKDLKKALKRKDIAVFNKFVNLYIASKYGNYDELQLTEDLKKSHCYNFASNVFTQLSNILFLEYGYMPIPSSDKTPTKKQMEKLFRLH